MKQAIFYWIYIALMGIVHLQAMVKNLSWKTPFYLTVLAAGVLSYFLYRRMMLQLPVLGTWLHILLFVMQLLILLVYTAEGPFWLNFIPVVLFIGLEATRIIGTGRLARLEKQAEQYEEEREHFNETFRIVRSERHDFLKHISSIHFMLDHGQPSEAKDYLDQLVEGYEETNLSIKGERGVVAGVLHQMHRRAKATGISLVYDLDLPLSTLPLSDKDLVALIGNLLANSIDAAEEWQQDREDQALITLQFYKRSGLFLLICKNSTLPISASILDHLFVSYGKTTKGEGHEGLGTKLIQNIVSDHQGFLDFVHKEEEFTVKIKIPAIR
ncbi:sensor histidine kinase [Mesobacillus foraminis]|uniref:sensor histidine kinase n=1 Tax=Mesobacillus foraminis TaxID=279826 RepID=UPI00214C52E3|nr:GHKL domain-containing protein [Mesobacillus foraminis]